MINIPLFEICRPTQWRTISSDEFCEAGYPVYGANGKIGYYSKYNHEKSTILITCRGATCGSVLISEPFSYINGNAMALDELDESIVDLKYFFHQLRYRGFADVISGSAQPQITREGLRSVKVSLPPLLEQRRIAAILDKAEVLCSKRREAIAKLDQLLQSVFLEMFGGDKGWSIQTIGDLAHVQGGLQLSNARSKIETLRPYLRVANVYRNKLELSEIKHMGVTESEFSRTQLKKNDLLIVEGHGNTDEIGRSAIWNGSISECTHQNHLIRCRIEDENFLPEYLNFYLNSDLGRFQLKRSSNTTSGLSTISISKVREVRVPTPPIELQKKWQTAQLHINQMCEAQEEQLSVSENLIRSLQNQYFR